MEKSLDVARYIVTYFQQREDLITQLKLQKLLYYVQGWHLAFFDKPAFNEEFQAWIHGPVNYEVYQEYRDYQWRPILEEQPDANLNDQLKELTNKVMEVYGTDSAIELELRTHREQPWIIARKGLPEDANSDAIITKKSMHDFFSGELANANN